MTEAVALDSAEDGGAELLAVAAEGPKHPEPVQLDRGQLAGHRLGQELPAGADARLDGGR